MRLGAQRSQELRERLMDRVGSCDVDDRRPSDTLQNAGCITLVRGQREDRALQSEVLVHLCGNLVIARRGLEEK